MSLVPRPFYFVCRGEDVDAPDLTIIDFNTVPLVQSRSLEPSYIDSRDIRREKEAFCRFKQRELEYWNVSVPFSFIICPTNYV